MEAYSKEGIYFFELNFIKGFYYYSYRNDERHGPGVLMFPDCSLYKGEFRDDFM